VVAGGIGPASVAAAPKKPFFTLTILHHHGGESELVPSLEFGGAAHFATRVDALRAEALESDRKVGVLLLSSGDNFVPIAPFSASLASGGTFYDALAMQLIGHDASGLGNHEFDLAPDVLADFIAGVGGALPFVSANLDFAAEPGLQALFDVGAIAKSIVLKQEGQSIGIVGATMPALASFSSSRGVLADAEVAAAVQAEIDALTARKIGIIIVLSHMEDFQEDLALAGMLSGVDVLIAGGSPLVLANPGDLLIPPDAPIAGLPYPLSATGADGVPVAVVATRGQYSYVGRLIADFDRAGNLVAIDPRSGPVRVAGGSQPDAVAPDPEVQARVVDPVAAHLAGLADEEIGTSEVALDARLTEVRTHETNLGNLVADALLWQANQQAAGFGVAPADVALEQGGGIRSSRLLPAGPISEADTFAVFPFGQLVAVVPDVPRARFKVILENAVSRMPAADPRFAQIAGFTFVWDPSGTPQTVDFAGTVLVPGTRVVEIVLDDGTVVVSAGAVVPGPPLSVATNDFLARGGDQYPFAGAPFTNLGVTDQQALSSYIADALGGAITAAAYPEGGEGRIMVLTP